ncbi:MAG: hypothetical protein ACJAU6_003975 [Alphaproteobacteria bacterium]|jgi:hypothetical protein
MLSNNLRPFKPVVVGPPRGGFTLCISVLHALLRHFPKKWNYNPRQLAFNVVAGDLGVTVSDAIVGAFAAEGIDENLIYNGNFKELSGGPKWIREGHDDQACFRKYPGVLGMGDFTLVISHPRELLDLDEVVHSHSHPGRWLSHDGYHDYVKFGPIRNPVGILNSSCFSLNALASEYIQKYVPAEEDNHHLREILALYKLTDIDFFKGLVTFLKDYYDAFMPRRHQFHVMRWEDLLDHPTPTIQAIASATGLQINDEYAKQIWDAIAHKNLTGHHKHNLSVGGGIVGDWKNWLINTHLDIIKEAGFEPYMQALGYDPITPLDEANYNDFQRLSADAIAKKTPYDVLEDRELFGFAFNKSNLDSDAFSFRRYDFREHTQIERSCFADEEMEVRIWDVAENAAGKLNALLRDVLSHDFHEPSAAARSLVEIKAKTHGCV